MYVHCFAKISKIAFWTILYFLLNLLPDLKLSELDPGFKIFQILQFRKLGHNIAWKLSIYGSVSPGQEFGPFCVTFLKKVWAYCNQTVQHISDFLTVPEKLLFVDPSERRRKKHLKTNLVGKKAVFMEGQIHIFVGIWPPKTTAFYTQQIFKTTILKKS